MKLSFKYIVKKGQKEQKKIIKDLIWHVTKVSNTLIYDIKEKKIEVNANESLNILRKYIKETIPNQEELAMDKGREQRPIKKRVA